MKTKLFSKILGVGLAIGLVFAMGAAIIPAGEAQADEMEWGEVTTPSETDFVIAQDTDIDDYAVGGEDGSIVYATVSPVVGLGSPPGATSSAEWVENASGDVATHGDYSVLLTKTATAPAGSAYLEFVPLPGTTLDDLNAFAAGDFGYRYKMSAFPGPQLELRFDDPDSVGYVELTLMQLQATMGALPAGWQEVSFDDTSTPAWVYYGVESDGSALDNHPGSGWGVAAIDTIESVISGEEVTGDASNWELTRVRVDLYEAGARTAYISEVTIAADDTCNPIEPTSMVFSSDDGGVTWSDITDTVQDASDLPNPFVNFQYGGVAIAPDNEDWVAIAGVDTHGNCVVVATEDGGSNFTYTGDMYDAASGTSMVTMYDIAVSPKVGNIYNIAVAGVSDAVATADVYASPGTVFRFKAGTWLGGSWVDTTAYNRGVAAGVASTTTTAYPGWDDSTDVSEPTLWTSVVIAVAFSPNFDLDDTIVTMGKTQLRDAVTKIATGLIFPYLQEGIWESGGTYNAEAGFSEDAVRVTNDGSELQAIGAASGLRGMGIALPADFDGTDSGDNNVYLYANAYETVKTNYGGFVMISEDGDLTARCGPSGDPLLASIAVHGDADTCKAMIGAYAAAFDKKTGEITKAKACAGVPVWHTVELDDCCPQWERACKDPSGPYMAVVTYAADGEKAFASTAGDVPAIYGGGLNDESAFSVSLDDAVSFNQIGLIDTDIDWLSDMVVCPDCETVYLSTINDDLEAPCKIFTCDSIWRTWTVDGDIGDVWERVYHGDWTDSSDSTGQLLLRLPCDEDEACCTVYLGVQDTKNLYYSRDCGQCWNQAVNQKLTIQDFAIESENIVYVLNAAGLVSTSTQYGRRPSDGVDTEVGSGHMITSCCDAGMVLVAGASDEPVGYSSDGGETWDLTDDLPGGAGTAHVACDTACTTDPIIYVATDESTSANDAGVDWTLGGSIYRSNLDDGAWDDLNAIDAPYSGIAIGVSDGTLYASSWGIGVDLTTVSLTTPLTICNRFVDFGDLLATDAIYSGVARNLTPCETDCCGEDSWNYLIAGTSSIANVIGTTTTLNDDGEYFFAEPSALRICGCTDIETPSILWAIDWDYEYDIAKGLDGTLWSYEDCAAKKGIVLTAPKDGAVLDCDVCATCDVTPFTLQWKRMCLACSYDIEIMDEDGNLIWEEIDTATTGDPPKFYFNESGLFCGNTYTWHVREANTSTGECVHSPWSETWSFTIAASSGDAVQLIAPEAGAMGVPLTGVGFTWSSVSKATSYSFVLSANADLSGALATSDQSGTAYSYSGTLDNETSYYWQVTAWKGSVMLSQSNIGTFSTAAEAIIIEPPAPGEPPIINIPPVQQIVPTWIYAVIGIGAALVVVVIVLIVKSRSPKA